jgi:hypothetical protein
MNNLLFYVKSSVQSPTLIGLNFFLKKWKEKCFVNYM